MGVIQSSINNLLATATIAAKLTPGLEERGEARRAADTATKFAKFANDMKGTDEQKLEVDKKMLKAGAEAIQKSTELFEANPTQKNYDRINKFKERQSANFNVAKKFKNWYDSQKMAEAAAEGKLQIEQQRIRNSEFFRKPTQSIEQDLKEIGGNQ